MKGSGSLKIEVAQLWNKIYDTEGTVVVWGAEKETRLILRAPSYFTLIHGLLGTIHWEIKSNILVH